MPQYDDVFKQIPETRPRYATFGRQRRPLLLRVAFIGLVLATLACGLGNARSQPAAGLSTRLPTLTRTPLPTLTPTPLAAAVALANNHTEPAAHQEPAPDQSPVDPTLDVSSSTEAPAADVASLESPAVVHNPTEAVSIDQAAAASPTAEPLATPTPTATATPAPLPTPSPTASVTPTPTPTPTETPLPKNWEFVSVRIDPNHFEDGLMLFGLLVNNTGVAQELISIYTTFYNAQGQVIATPEDTYAYWPGYVVPAGGSLPFEVTAEDLSAADSYLLEVEAIPSDQPPRQDFELSTANQWLEDGYYCLAGNLRNPGSQLDDYLLIAAVLYDGQNQVIGFGEYEEFGQAAVTGGKTSDFEICVNSANQAAARHELHAWGR